MGKSCSELQASFGRCQKSRHMPGPRGDLRFTSWALFTITRGIRAKWLVGCQTEERPQGLGRWIHSQRWDDLDTWEEKVVMQKYCVSIKKAPKAETLRLCFRLSCPFFPKRTNIGTSLDKR